MAIDLEPARGETPGCAHVLHFNSARAALMPRCVLEATVGYLEPESRIGGSEAAAQGCDAIERTYDTAAQLIAIWPRVRALADLLRSGLNELPSIEVRDLGAVKCGTVAFRVDGQDPREVRRKLRRQNMNVSAATSRCSRRDIPHAGGDDLVRVSVHYYNSEEEVERFCRAIESLL